MSRGRKKFYNIKTSKAVAAHLKNKSRKGSEVKNALKAAFNKTCPFCTDKLT
jgi:hypothetical protein